jgi:hypothetical protein
MATKGTRPNQKAKIQTALNPSNFTGIADQLSLARQRSISTPADFNPMLRQTSGLNLKRKRASGTKTVPSEALEILRLVFFWDEKVLTRTRSETLT